MKQRVAVIGSGIAGTAVAELLCREGWKVALIERAAAPASQASGNPAGLTMPYLSPAKHHMQRVYSVATDIAWRAMRELFDKGLLPSWNPCGAIEVPAEERIKILIKSGCSVPGAKLVSAQEATELLGVAVQQRCLYMERAALVCPLELCQAHLAAAGANLERYFGREVAAIEHKSKTWQVLAEGGDCIVEADMVVIANAGDCAQIEQTKALTLETLRGEILIAPVNQKLAALRAALCFQGYLLPQVAGSVVLGATFTQPDADFDEDKQQELLLQLQEWLPDITPADFQGAQRRASYRSSTYDRLPYIGAVPGYDGLYVSVGHGLRGLSSAHLAARMLKDLINANGVPPPDEIFKLLSPGRRRSEGNTLV
jgi:tRNA 5-methylaminomethyl-2-thiouridine biosynthesis bifunctional protein